MLSSVFILTLWVVTTVLCSSRTVVTHTSAGPIHGETVHSRDPRTNTPISYTSYKTIPFAKPPVGDLRFAAPQPLGPGEGGNNNTNVTYMRACYQLGNLLGCSTPVRYKDFDIWTDQI